MESGAEAAPRELGENYAEFLFSMQVLSGSSQREMAELIGISHGSVSSYMRGSPISRTNRIAIGAYFGLSDEESRHLGGGIPIEYKTSPEESRLKREQAVFREQLGQALLERVVSGPPLGELEEKLLRDLGGLSISE